MANQSASCVSQQLKAGIVARVGIIAVEPVNRASGLAGRQRVPNLADTGRAWRRMPRACLAWVSGKNEVSFLASLPARAGATPFSARRVFSFLCLETNLDSGNFGQGEMMTPIFPGACPGGSCGVLER